jgi:hypothetical protein
MLKNILKGLGLKSEDKQEDSPVTVVAETGSINEATSSAAYDIEADDEELVAAITAAVMACLGGNSKIVVRKIRRTDAQTPVWGMISRTEQMATRF